MTLHGIWIPAIHAGMTARTYGTFNIARIAEILADLCHRGTQIAGTLAIDPKPGYGTVDIDTFTQEQAILHGLSDQPIRTFDNHGMILIAVDDKL